MACAPAARARPHVGATPSKSARGAALERGKLGAVQRAGAQVEHRRGAHLQHRQPRDDQERGPVAPHIPSQRPSCRAAHRIGRSRQGQPAIPRRGAPPLTAGARWSAAAGRGQAVAGRVAAAARAARRAPVAAAAAAGAGRVAVGAAGALVQAAGQVGRERQVAQRRRDMHHALVARHVPQPEQLGGQHLRAGAGVGPRPAARGAQSGACAGRRGGARLAGTSCTQARPHSAASGR